MAGRDVWVRLGADSSKMERGFKSAEQSAKVFARALEKAEREQQRLGQMQAAATREMQADFAKRRAMEQAAGQVRARAAREMEADFARRAQLTQREGDMQSQALREMEADFERRRDLQMGYLDDMGRGLLAFGAATTVGLGLAARSAMKWESAWAGVLKVVDGTPEQLDALQEGLRQLANRLPATAQEIAGVAEAAGQMGVAIPDMLKFTETAIALGVATNMTSEEAATGLAKLGNIMGVTTGEVDRAGAALVALGNAGESTESDILSMSLRIAGAGVTAGLSEANVMSLASAMSSMGIEAEMGGSAISRVISDINSDVLSASGGVEDYAEVAGMSAKKFADAWRSDPAQALEAFIAGFGRMQKAGGDVYEVMGRLAINDVRVKDTMLRLGSGATDVAEALDLGNKAWEDNNALIAEAARRYATAESRIAVARNQLNNAAIDIGGTVLPVIASVATAGGTLAEMWRELPGPVREAATWLGVAAAGIGLVGGTALIAVPRVVAFRAALDEVAGTGGRVGKTAGGLQKALGGVSGFLTGPWGLALGAATAIAGVFIAKQVEGRQRVRELADTLDDATSAITENTRALTVRRLEEDGVLKSAAKIGLSYKEVTDAALGNAAAIDKVTEATSKYSLVAAKRRSHDEASKASMKVRDAVLDESSAVRKATEAHEREKAALGDVTTERKAAIAAVEEQQRATDEMADGVLDAREAARRMARAIREASEAAKENTKSVNKQGTEFRRNTEAGLENSEKIDELARSTRAAANAALKASGSQAQYTKIMREGREQFVKAATDMGMSRRAAQRLADSLGLIPPKVKVNVDTSDLDRAIRKSQQLYSAARNMDYKPPSAYKSSKGDGKEIRRAAGGIVPRSAGSGVIDDVPALLTAGEFVVNAAATAANRELLERINAGAPQPASVAVRASSGARGGAGTVIHQHFHLDQAAAISTASGYARATHQEAARAERLMQRRG